MYISTTQAAKKFNISKRRVQFLCKQNDILGAIKVSGVWLIPDNALKPTDRRKKIIEDYSIPSDVPNELISLQEACRILSISTATAKNWLRLGKLIATEDGTTFQKSYILSLAKRMHSGEDNRLKSRRNKKSLKGKFIYKDYIYDTYNQSVMEDILSIKPNLTERELRLVLANFAVQLFYQSRGKELESNIILYDYIKKSPKNTVFYSLITNFIGMLEPIHTLSSDLVDILNHRLTFIRNEDTLGFCYISLRDIHQRKLTGAYYTPKKTIHVLIDNVINYTNLYSATIFDPCCGTGNFLIELLERGVNIHNIYAQDIDIISILLTQINIAILCEDITLDILQTHFLCEDTLTNTFPQKFDIVLGNPPWGFAFSEEAISDLHTRYITAKKRSLESYDLFVEKSLQMLKPNGLLSFVLPEAVLTVASHLNVRKLLIEHCSFPFISYLGNVFSGVQCPSIILGATFDNLGNTMGCQVSTNTNNFTIHTNRHLDATSLAFHVSDDENNCLETISSIPNATFFSENNAIFALGIVTGNNKQYIVHEPKETFEIILKGSDIQRYSIKKTNNYIKFQPDKFQQIASTEVYRAPEKLLYRFICEVPVFTYDNQQTLSLNSCNILIPKIEGLHIKYILAILNSTVATFFLSKKFRFLKLLRSHLEQLPIPLVDVATQEQIIEKVDHLLSSKGNIRQQYEELDEAIMNLYQLNDTQKQIMKQGISEKNLFLMEC